MDSNRESQTPFQQNYEQGYNTRDKRLAQAFVIIQNQEGGQEESNN